jgi:hypothetical protein
MVAITMNNAPQVAVGAPAMLGLAERWGGAAARAAALLRRVDVVGGVLDITGAPELSGLREGDDDAGRVEAARAVLPAASLLVLDECDRVHLVGLRDGPFQLRPRETLREWGEGEVSVRIRPGRDGLFRAVEVSDGHLELLVAAPWRSSRQRAALELIEQLTRQR